MKNYDIKNAVNELSNTQIHIDKKRIAFLVPNMFNRVKSGFLKNVGPNNNFNQSIVDNNVQVNSVDSSINTANTNVTVNADNAVENQDVKPKEKNYGVIVSFSEAKKLHDNVISAKEPRKLLISQTFLGKLISNRKSKMVNDLVDDVPPITNNNLTFDPVAKYHELINERTRLIESVKSIEAEITKLVRDNNLTQEQVSRVKVA